MELMSGVHFIESMAQSALLTDDRLLLVDTTYTAGAPDIVSYLKEIGYKPGDLTSIVITHVHPDHVSGLAALVEASEAEVASHRIEAPFISKQENYPGGRALPHAAVEVDVLLEDGDRYQELTIIHAPGHTPGNLALLDENRGLLIAGDSMRTDGNTIGPMMDQNNINPAEHRDSMKKIAGFEFEALIVGHGEPMTSGARDRLREAVAKL
jgi:glyoxylase-like metal-dependent hydrolase (beta-lactamase superfamily II)